MKDNFPVCKVRVINDSTNDYVYFGAKEINITQLKAIKISDKIFLDNRNLDIMSFVFDYDNLILEIHVEY